MFYSYLRIAFRTLFSHKLYSAINVFGLALGIACSLFIGLWVHYELSYDRFLPQADRVYFVRYNFLYNGQITTGWTTPSPLQEAIARDVPQIAAVAKITLGAETLIRVGEKVTKAKGHYATDAFFNVFQLPALAGNPASALAQPNQIVITHRLAQICFPDGQALGKTVQVDNNTFYVVGALIEDLPGNSTLQFDWIINWKAQQPQPSSGWGNSTFLTYARLHPDATVAQAEATMKGIYPRYTDPSNTAAPILHPITDMRLYSHYQNGKAVGGGIEYVRIFSLVALFILLIACINFMNLATARSSLRAKEVGVRKAIGALRGALVSQFLTESLLLSSLAAGLALLLVVLLLPVFNAAFHQQLHLDLTEPVGWAILLGLVLLTGLLAGSYPALYLSSLQPIRILKGKLRVGSGPAQFRRVLVVFQFALSVFLIVGMLAVNEQMAYLRNKNLGLDRQNVVYIPLEGELTKPSTLESFRQQLTRQPSIFAATTASELPVDVRTSTTDLSWPGKDPLAQRSVFVLEVGNDFTRTMNIKLLAGRDFRLASPADSASYLVNEAAAKMMGMVEPVGQEITFWSRKGRIIGLMQNFHSESMHKSVEPMVLVLAPIATRYVLVKTGIGQTTQALADLERLTKQFNPNYPFTYHFVDEDYQKLYQREAQVSILVNVFGVLAIVISCLGLFGLAAFTAEQRTKEIGVRKVLGAGVSDIVGMLSKDFMRLVLLAIVLALPLAGWALSEWLTTFAYRTALSWWMFAGGGLLAIVIAQLTVSYQSIKAALMNPVKSLRAE